MPQQCGRRDRVTRGKLSAFRLLQAQSVPGNIGQLGLMSGRKSWQQFIEARGIEGQRRRRDMFIDLECTLDEAP